MAQLCEASTILKRLSERLYQYNNCDQQVDIDSLKQILDSPLFNTLYNLQESFQQLKFEFEKGNHLIKNCLFDFDIEGHLKLINEKITNQNIEHNNRLADNNIIRKAILNKQTPYESLGFSIVAYKHRLFDINAIFIQDIQSNSLADLNGQLHIGDQIVCVNDIYLDSRDSTLAVRAHQFLIDSTRLSIELVVIAPTADYPHAAASTSNEDGHSCVPTLSTPFNVDMVLNTLWTQIEVVELINDGSGLGFGITGNKSTGVVVKAIVPGSIADKDGRIRTGDHLFQINHVCVRGMSSEQVAGILRQSSQQVRLVIARSVREPTATSTTDTAMNTPPLMSQRTSLTSETLAKAADNIALSSTTPSLSMIIDNDGIISSSQNKILLRTERLLESNHNFEKILENLREQCQQDDGTKLLDVTLEKGDDGLGITVAGYVSPDSTNNDAIAGIFIRDIADDSVCARDGRLIIGDQIIEVNDQSLNGFSNVQALYLLQNTSSSVRLKVRRYLDGIKYEKIKEMIALESSHQIEEKIEFQSQLDVNEQIRQKWLKILGTNSDILIADVYKPDHGGLGITLEGTVDIENGEEVRPHHYIRALLRDGPIGTEGTLTSGDELLEVNNQVLYGKNHIHVIEILKRVKHQVKLVCSRRKISQINETTVTNNNHNRARSTSFGKTAEIVVKAKSMGTLDSTNLSFHFPSPSIRSTNQFKSRSLEVISNLALWSTSIVNIELYKSDNGLGFSVLDYQDPSNPSYSPVIVIRSLVPGGVAQLDGRIVPGDRLVAVNDITLENMYLDDVIKILKSTPKGSVKLSLSKPLPYPKFKNDNDEKIISDTEQEINNNNQRASRSSKSKTTTAVTNKHQRSASSHRPSHSPSIKQAAVSAGISVSAPAILSRHEYIESLLNKENMRKKTEQRASSANRTNRHGKMSPRFSSLDKKQSKEDQIRQLNTEQYLDLLPRKKSQLTTQKISTHTVLNLPEFYHFKSDHLVLIPQIASHPFYDRLRGPSAFSTTKFNRQAISNINSNNNIITQTTTTTTTVVSGGSPRTSYSSKKRSSRSRQIHDTTNNHEPQQTHIIRPSSLRQMTNKFDSMACFQEKSTDIRHVPDLSSDDDHHNNNNNNNYNAVLSSSSSSSSLTHRHSIQNVICPTTTAPAETTIVDEDAHEVDSIIKQHQRTLLNNNNNENTSVIASTIKTPTTPTITSKWTSSRQSSRMASPALSTSSQSSGRVITFLNHEVIQLPIYLEREIRVKYNFDQLGLVVDAYVDEGVNGCFLRSITPTATTINQHGLRPGDYLLSINNESMKKISNAQARSILRRASLIGSDISVIFIPGDAAKQFKDHTLDPHATTSPVPPDITDSDIEPSLTKPITTKTTPTEEGDSYGFDSNNNQQTYSTVIDSETLSATLWGSPRTVILYRNEHVKSLGISIVGGKLDFSGPGNTIESCISGIFIKHVLPDSPAGRNGTLKTGDRILEVNGNDLRDASHDRAVEIIRAAQSPVHFIVQSLLDPSNPTSSTNDNSSTHFSHIPTTNSPSQNKTLTTNRNSFTNVRKTEDELLKQYGHLIGDLFFFDIKRNLSEIHEPLGLSLIGHRDPNKLAVFVCDIQPGSLLDRDNRIRPGDQLLEVNGEILLGKAHSTVTPIIKSIKADTLNFVVLRNPHAINDMALNNQHAATARIRASAMTSAGVHLTSTSPKLVQSQLSPSSSQHPLEQQMTNDASRHQHHVLVPRHQPDVNEYKENDDRLTSTSVFPLSTHTSDEIEHIQNKKNERKYSASQTATTRDEKLSVAEDMSTSSSLPYNPIITTNDVQSDNNEVSSLNHKISSNATITAFHSISSDVNSPTRHFIPSSFDQQSYAYGNDEPLPPLPSSTTTTSSSLLMHEQANHANHKYSENQNQMSDDIFSNNNQTSTSPKHKPVDKSKNEPSPTHSSSVIQSNEFQTQTNNILPSDVIISSPSKQKKEDNLSDIPTTPIKTTTTINGAVTSHIPIMSSSSSSSSSLSVSTPSSGEHATKKQVLLSSTQVPRRASMSAPGAPITLILNKDQKGSFGLTLIQHDNGIWVQSVQPHGPADQQDIRAGDQIIQINGTPTEALKFSDIQDMLEHANSNQIHVTCIPYREPQAEPVVVNINQAESLPILIPNEIDVAIKEDDPRTRSIVVGQETLIEIDRGQSGLGLSVVGGLDTQLSAIIIHDIYDGCAAQRDGRLLVGDQILEVNSIDLRSATHEEAIQALRQATNIIRILVLRGKMLTEMMNEQDKFDLITIELIKKSGKGLGFSIIGRRHGYGVFISHILEGGCAEKDGRLMSGDLILEVNGQDLRTAAYEHVAYTLKTLPHGRVNIKIGRLKPSAITQNRQNSVPNDRKNRSRSSSSNLRRSSAHKINDR